MATKMNGGSPSAMKWAEQRRQEPAHRDEIEALLAQMNLEQDLLALREASGITQVELARRVGVSQPAIAKLESGNARNVEIRTLVKVAAALGARVKISFERATPVRVAKSKRAKKRAAA